MTFNNTETPVSHAERLSYIKHRLDQLKDRYVFGPQGHAFYKVNNNVHDLQPSDHRQDVEVLKELIENLDFALIRLMKLENQMMDQEIKNNLYLGILK